MVKEIKEEIHFFTAETFEEWLIINYLTDSEIWVGFYKKSTGLSRMTWSESVDVALVYGWIDGIRKSVDEMSYKIRFTPRNPNSVWSAINVNKVKALIDQGKMTDKGLELFNKRKDKTGYSTKDRNMTLIKEYEDSFRSNTDAWTYFMTTSASYKQNTIWWVMSAKKRETQIKRLKILIDSSSRSMKVPHMRR